MCFRIYVHYYFHLFVWFFFSFYFITTCSWYFSYNIVNKMFDFFLLYLSNYWNDRKKVSGGTQKTGFKLYGVSPKLFGLTLPVLPPFHLSLTFFTDYPNNTTPINPFTNAFAEKKKGFFLLLCFQHQTLKLKASLALR